MNINYKKELSETVKCFITDKKKTGKNKTGKRIM